MDPIDLRSDTVTRPGPAMRQAMASAEVGDDVYGEDPTVTRLEALAAEILGKPAALFVPSGTMANQLALGALARRGDVVLAGASAHVLRYESGAAAGIWGLQIHTIGQDGLFDADAVIEAIPVPDVHHAPATVLALENTHNVSGGRVWPPEQLVAVAEAARSRGLAVHLDGARLFNAAAACGRSPAELAAPVDTVSFCLSKGLGAPVGSLVCADAERIAVMRRLRKMLGGGMRQAGILAAAGLHALEHHVARLPEDHANAKALATGLAERGLGVEPPETNIVLFRAPPSGERAPAVAYQRAARERGVLVSALDRSWLRAVTHLDVDRPAIDEALARLASV